MSEIHDAAREKSDRRGRLIIVGSFEAAARYYSPEADVDPPTPVPARIQKADGNGGWIDIVSAEQYFEDSHGAGVLVPLDVFLDVSVVGGDDSRLADRASREERVLAVSSNEAQTANGHGSSGGDFLGHESSPYVAGQALVSPDVPDLIVAETASADLAAGPASGASGDAPGASTDSEGSWEHD